MKCAVGQCPVDVYAGPDTIICHGPDTFQLTGEYSGNYVDLHWSPGGVVSDSTRLDPYVFVDTSLTLALTATAFSPTNVIENGDFSQGNSGFSSMYNYTAPGGFFPPGHYTIHDNANQIHGAFANCDDVTGDGLMFIADGATVAGTRAWCQTVDVQANTIYQFSYWSTSLFYISASDMQVFVNGILTGPVNTNTLTQCDWQQYEVEFITGDTTHVEVCIQNMNTEPGGNDFALDGIEMYEMCQVKDEITVELGQVEAVVNDPEAIDCDRPTVTLDGGQSTRGQDVTYSWTTINGEIIGPADTIRAEAGKEGVYILTVTYKNNCLDRDTVVVESNVRFPEISLSAPAITCERSEVEIDLNADQDSLVIQWTGPDGFTSSSPEPQVAMPGMYIVEATNTACCSSCDSILIFEDTEIPDVELFADTLNCKHPVAHIGAESMDTLEDIQWFGPANFASNAMEIEVEVPGTYVMEAVNPLNGCLFKDSVIVFDNSHSLEIGALSLERSNCSSSNGELFIDTIQGGEAPYLVILEETDTLSRLESFPLLSPGSYLLEILDAAGCSVVTSINVPFFDTLSIGVTPMLEIKSGSQSQIDLDIISDPQDVVNISWSPANTVSCTNCEDPYFVGQENTTLEVVITDRWGCEVKAMVEVVVIPEENIYIPNVFSPKNRDGINDRFTLYAKPGTISRIDRLCVYDRWGELVFEQKDFPPNDESFGWNGRFLGKYMNPGVFLYVAEVELRTGESRLFKGNVTLIQ